MIFDFILATFGGLITASWGAYKDSPYEGFSPFSFVRSVVVTSLYYFGLKYFLTHNNFSSHPLLVMLSAIAFERLTQEFNKAFIRKTQRENTYKIPQLFHYMGNVFSYVERLLIGLAVIIVLLTGLFLLIKTRISGYSWIWIGLLMATIPSIGGAYKDAPIEGFDIKKFPRSFLIMFSSIVLLHTLTDNMMILVAAGAGLERVLVEYYKTFVIRSIPGKFIGNVISPEWISKRRMFIYSYAGALLIILASSIYFSKIR